MQRQKRLTKRERKAVQGPKPAQDQHAQHIHCIACGKRLDQQDFTPSGSAIVVTCQHGSNFPSCRGCELESRLRLDEHDRTGAAVKTASAWH